MKIISSILFVLLLINCGGGGDKTPTSTQSENPPETEIKTSQGKIELGPVKGASVAIQTLNGYTLYQTQTDDKGDFSINIDQLKEAVEAHNENITLVKIISTGGIDTDPNDDGAQEENEAISVQGSVTGFVPLELIYTQNGYRINLLTSAIASILENAENINQQDIEQAAKELGVYDIDGDDKITVQDLLFYKMAEDESHLEQVFRENVLPNIHNNDSEAIENFVDDLKYEYALINPDIKIDNSGFSTMLKKSNINNKIYYSLNPSIEPEYELYGGQQLALNAGDVLFYKECIPNEYCHRVQKVFYYNNGRYELTYPRLEQAPDISEASEKLDTIWVNIQTTQNSLTVTQSELEKLKEQKEEIQAELEELAKQEVPF